MIQLFTQPKSIQVLSASENSQGVKINSHDHQSEGGFGKQLSDVLQKFMGYGEQQKNHEFSEEKSGTLVTSEDSSVVHTALHSKESEQVQIRLISEKKFILEEHHAKNGTSNKFSSAGITKSITDASSESVNPKKVLKNFDHKSTAPGIVAQNVQNDSVNLVAEKSMKGQVSEVKSNGAKQDVQMEKTGITLKEVFAGNVQNSVSNAEAENSPKISEGTIKNAVVTDEGNKNKNIFKPGRSFPGLNFQNNQSSEKTGVINSQVADHSGIENRQGNNPAANKPVREFINSQAAGISVSKEPVPAAEKNTKTSDRLNHFKIDGDGERDLLKSTERMDFQRTEKAAYNKTPSGQKINTFSSFDQVVPQTDSKEPASKAAGELFGTDLNEKKLSNTREPVAIRPEQSVLFQQAERRNLSVRLAKIVKQELQSGKMQGQGWKKHQFTLDDGTKVQLSLRKTEGVIQLQLGSVNSELNKLIQQHAQEIRQHLEEQMNAEVNLQFQEATPENGNGLFSDNNSGSEPSDGKNQEKMTGNADKQLPHEGRRTRLFGFNSNEWTA
jgi:hypothetical protein